VLRKKFVLPKESICFVFLDLFLESWFCMMSSSKSHYDLNVKILTFVKKYYKVHNVEVSSQDQCQKKEFKVTHNYKYEV
jgi:hypothetical protein